MVDDRIHGGFHIQFLNHFSRQAGSAEFIIPHSSFIIRADRHSHSIVPGGLDVMS